MKINRKEALEILKKNLKNENLIKHSLAVEAGMKALSRYFKENEERWGLCGLLHDIDYEITKGDPQLHSKLGSQMLKDLGFDEEICKAILSHNEIHKVEPESLMAKALYCVDPLTGLIVAATLVLPSKKINDLKVENVLNRFKEKAFARGANRESIKKCEVYLNISLEEFIQIILSAMQRISNNLGL